MVAPIARRHQDANDLEWLARYFKEFKHRFDPEVLCPFQRVYCYFASQVMDCFE